MKKEILNKQNQSYELNIKWNCTNYKLKIDSKNCLVFLMERSLLTFILDQILRHYIIYNLYLYK